MATKPLSLKMLMFLWVISLGIFLPGTGVKASQSVGFTKGTFQVNGNGAATYTIPIAVPPGTNKMQPELSLSYNSQQKNGLLGIGWQLSGLSTITRCGKTLATDGQREGINFNPEDRFCINGQRLIAVQGYYGDDGTIYKTEKNTNTLFTSYGKMGSGPEYFTAKHKNGFTTQYGKTVDSRLSIVPDIGSRSILSWSINKTIDRNGNYISVEYSNNSFSNGNMPMVEHYPKTIRYTGNDGSGFLPQRKIVFQYNSFIREDILWSYFQGTAVITFKRLTAIDTYVGQEHVKRYKLGYEYSEGLEESRLVTLQECGSNHSTLCFPAAEFRWQDNSLSTLFGGYKKTQIKTPYCADGSSGFAICNDEDNWKYIQYPDVNGDGRADLVYRGDEGIWVSFDGDDGFPTANRYTICANGSRQWGVCNDVDNWNYIRYPDVNGDGKADLVYRGDEGIQVWFGSDNGFVNHVSSGICANRSRLWGVCNDEDNFNYIQYPDVNGDGKADLVYRGDEGIQIWFGSDKGFVGHISSGICADRSRSWGICNDEDNFNYIQYPDVNGDGKADLVYRGDEGIQVWFGSDNGFVNHVSSGICANGSRAWGVCNDENNFSHIRYPDVDGNGKADLVYRGDEGIQVWFGSVVGFVDRRSSDICADGSQSWGVCNDDDNFNYIRYPDVNGDGKADLVYRGDQGIQIWFGNNNGFINRSVSNICANRSGQWGVCNDEDNFNYIRYIDINGDSKTDLLYRGDEGIQAWLRSDSGFVDHMSSAICANGSRAWGVCNDEDNFNYIWYSDVNGDGKVDLVYRGDEGIQAIPIYEAATNVITTISNGVGSHTPIQYKPLTDPSVYSKDSASILPKQDFIGPVYVVANHSIRNGRRIAYRYRHHYSGAKIHRLYGWLGFSKSSIINIEAGTQVSNYYYQDFPLVGMIKKVVNQTLDGQDLGTARYEYNYKENRTPIYNTNIYTVYKSKVETDHYTEGNRTYTLGKKYIYDNSKTRIISITDAGEVLDNTGNLSTLRDDIHTCFHYANHDISRYSDDWWKGYFPVAIKRKRHWADCSFERFSAWNRSSDLSFSKFAYDRRQNIIKQNTWDDKKAKWITTQNDYDGYGNPTMAIDPLGSTFRVEYDEVYHTFPIRAISPKNHQGISLISSSYYEPKFGIKTRHVNANNITTSYVPQDGIDPFGRIISLKEANPSGVLELTTKRAYQFIRSQNRRSRRGSTAGIKIINFHRTHWGSDGDDMSTWTQNSTSHDALGRRYRSESQGSGQRAPIYTDILFDRQGRVWKQSMPYEQGDAPVYTVTEYDNHNRQSKIIRPNGAVETIDYSYLSNRRIIKTTPNPSGSGTVDHELILDSRGRVIESISPNKGRSFYEYDPLGRRTKVTDPLGVVTTFQYNSLGQLTEAYKPSLGLSRFDYDDLGRTISSVDAKKQKTLFSYDQLGRMTEKKVYAHENSNTTESATSYHYDSQGSHFGVGRLSAIYSNKVNYHYSYDATGNVKTSTVSLDTNNDGRLDKYSTSYSYDALSRISTVTYPDSASAAYLYNQGGHLSKIQYRKAGSSQYVDQATYYDYYNALGQAGRVDFKNGAFETHWYDNIGRKTKHDINTTDHTGPSFSYTWSQANKIESITADPASLSEQFQYSDMGFLVTKSNFGSAQGDSIYAYDTAGNLTQRSSYKFLYDSVKKHQIIGGCKGTSVSNCHSRNPSYFSVKHDLTGNIAEKNIVGDQTRYTYDAENRLTQVSKNGVVVNRFSYGSGTDRIAKEDFNSRGRLEQSTYYISNLYEVVNRRGRLQHTNILHGPSGPVATFTNTGASQNAFATPTWIDYQNKLIAANHLLKGSVIDKINYYFTLSVAQLSHPHSARIITQGLLLLALLIAVSLTLLVTIRLAARDSLLGKVRSSALNHLVSFGRLSPATAQSWNQAWATQWSKQRHWTRRCMPCVLICFITFSFGQPVAHAFSGGNGTPVVGQALYFHQNHINSVVSITDQTGRQINQVDYQPYGEINENHTSGPNSFRAKFTGKELDQDSGLYYFGARYYDPQLGRFLTPDPAGQFFSPYSYAKGDPLTNIDPDGRFVVTLTIIVIGIIIGAYAGGSTANHSMNPASWDWKSGKTWAGITIGGALGGIFAGADVGVLGAVGAEMIGSSTALAINLGLGALGGMAFTGMGIALDAGFDHKHFSAGEVFKGLGLGALSGLIFTAAGEGFGRLLGLAGRRLAIMLDSYAAAAADSTETLEREMTDITVASEHDTAVSGDASGAGLRRSTRLQRFSRVFSKIFGAVRSYKYESSAYKYLVDPLDNASVVPSMNPLGPDGFLEPGSPIADLERGANPLEPPLVSSRFMRIREGVRGYIPKIIKDSIVDQAIKRPLIYVEDRYIPGTLWID